MLADALGSRGTVRAVAQRSLLLPTMAIAAVLGAVVMAVVVAGAGETPTPAAAPPPVTVGGAPTSTGASAAAGDQTDPSAGSAGDQGGVTGQGDGSFVTVPSLVGLRLDEATAQLSDASLDRRIDGGGLFGVLDDTAWTVCATTPDAGTEVVPGDVVVVHVDRSC